MGDLLAYNQSFDWVPQNIDRSVAIENLNTAVLLANEFGDNLYYNPMFYEPGTGSFNLFNILWANDFNTFRITFPWIKELQFQVLMLLPNYFKNSIGGAMNLQELQANTGIPHNAWIGLFMACPEFLVHDRLTWTEFHRSIVSAFSFEERCEYFDYFSRFYQPNLTMHQNQIQQEIDQGHIHNSITRIDPPLIPFEKIHIHFNNNEKCALNIDGTWKHEVAGFVIPQEACEQLNKWGFMLPRQYYQK
jgi:hypothetical protein